MEKKLYQFVSKNGAFIPDEESLITEIDIDDAPSDIDYSQWGMLHDGEDYLLYIKKKNTDTVVSTLELYLFAFSQGRYKYLKSQNTIKVTGIPPDADTSSFSMLYGGNYYHLYLGSNSDNSIYQFFSGTRGGNFEFGEEFKRLNVENNEKASFPGACSWAMAHQAEGSAQNGYKIFSFSKGDCGNIKRRSYEENTESYKCDKNLSLANIPDHCSLDNFGTLHDGENYRLYLISK